MHFASPVPQEKTLDHSKFPDNLVVKTEHLTAEIQKLLADAQSAKIQEFSYRASNIQSLVDAMWRLLPVRMENGQIKHCLAEMVDSSINLTVQCSKDAPTREFQEQLSCQVVQGAFEIAKSAKQLMVLIQG